ncbi:hypothetical protein N2152v2_003163 [Parachlorella kessleri]
MVEVAGNVSREEGNTLLDAGPLPGGPRSLDCELHTKAGEQRARALSWLASKGLVSVSVGACSEDGGERPPWVELLVTLQPPLFDATAAEVEASEAASIVMDAFAAAAVEKQQRQEEEADGPAQAAATAAVAAVAAAEAGVPEQQRSPRNDGILGANGEGSSAAMEVAGAGRHQRDEQGGREGTGGSGGGSSRSSSRLPAEGGTARGTRVGKGKGDGLGGGGAGEGEGEEAPLALPQPSELRDSLFRMVLPSDWQREEGEPPGLRCTLYRYQRRALSWMLWRESFSRGPGAAPGGHPLAEGDPDSVKSRRPRVSLAWQKVPGQAVWWNPLERRLSRAPLPPPFPEVAGGLLCDEMGLGKTVEIIALVLANRAPGMDATHAEESGAALYIPGTPGGQAPAAAAATEQPPAVAAAEASLAAALAGAQGSNCLPQNGKPGGARLAATVGRQWCGVDDGTLVVCPSPLLQQWRAELGNHAHGSLRVEVYDGLLALRPPANDRKKPVGRPTPAKRASWAAYLAQAQREAELYERMLSGDSVAPAFDPDLDARLAAGRLRQADVVLTTFDVLQREVYYAPNERASGLRHAKRYAIPTCPLLQVRWWRLVVDEAQLVGPLSASGAMVEKMHAVHRWCVTGTPLTSHGLNDVRGLLHVLKHEPFSDPMAWARLVGEPYSRGDPACWALLRALLRPLMWRNTKAEVAEEYRLPPRALRVSHLTFQSGEKEVYDQILEDMRNTRNELRQEEEEQQQGPAVAPPAARTAGGGRSPAGAGAGASGRKRRRGDKLREEAARELLQLRLACIHPQLTRHWQQLSSDLQLNMGGTLSMQEIMQRLVDKAQYELQEKERALCAHLNTLAMALLGTAGKAAAGAGKGQKGDGGEEEGEPGPSSPATKKRRRSGGQPPREAQQEALSLLEQSYRVGEKGIDALDTPLDKITDLDDITAAGGTIVAWRKLQVNTEHQLALLYRALGREEEAEKMGADLKVKAHGVKEGAELELSMAQARLEALRAQAEEARAALLAAWQRAARLGFPVGSWGGGTRDAAAWLEEVSDVFSEAQQEEAADREAQEGGVQHVLGERVHKALGELEKTVQGELGLLERYVDAVRLQEGLEQLHDGLAAVTAGADQARLEEVSGLMQRLLRLLPTFKRKTLQAHWFWVLPPNQPAAQPVAVGEDATAAGGAAPGPRGAVSSQQPGGGAGQAGADTAPVVDLTQGPGGRQQQGQDPGSSTSGSGRQQQPPLAAPELVEELRRLEASTGGGAAFAAAARFLAAVPGFAFKLGDQGLGYYRDQPPAAAPLLTPESVHQCAAQVRRALHEQQHKLDKQRSPDTRRLDSCPLEAVEARLASAQQQVWGVRIEAWLQGCYGRGVVEQMGREKDPGVTYLSYSREEDVFGSAVHLLRLLKDSHVAECNVILKSAVAADLEADLAAAAEAAPLALTSPDVIRKRMHALRQEALAVRAKKRYMQGRLQEAGQLAAGGTAGAAAGAEEGVGEAAQEVQAGPSSVGMCPAGDFAPAQATQTQNVGLNLEDSSRQQRQHPPKQQQWEQQQRQRDPGAGASGTAGLTDLPAERPGPAEANLLIAGASQQGAALECPVCFNPIQEDIMVFGACGHSFCAACAPKLVLERGECAVCRTKVTSKQVYRVAAGSGASPVQQSDPGAGDAAQEHVVGAWSIKVQAVVRRILALTRGRPDEKCLVFSQFPDALKVLARALDVNGVRHVQLAGSKQAVREALKAFNDDEDVRVFLLSHRAGATGLTLVRASHVFLLEPALEPAIEQQAIARVHRIGQMRPVTIHRLLVRGSIEEQVVQIQESKHSLLAGEQDDSVTTAEPVKNESMAWGDMETLIDSLL